MSSVSFTLPYPPSVNQYWRTAVKFSRNKRPFVRTYISDKGKKYRVDVTAALWDRFGRRLRAFSGRVSVTINVCCPDRKKRDLDNVLKATLDAMSHCDVWVDDDHVDELHVLRGPVGKPGKLEITLETL